MGLLAIVLVLVALVFLPLDAGATDLIKNIGVGQGPSSVAVDPTTNKNYVANAGSNTLPGINGQTHAVSAVTVGSAPDGVGVDAATTLSVQTNPGGVVVDAARNKIYVTNRSANQHSDRYRDQYARSSSTNTPTQSPTPVHFFT